jgi:hypothetical protein
MRDVSKLLASTALESGKKERSYDGFDISHDQFPSTPEHPFRFHVQNILQPFPPEHYNQYDLVQVRFLTAALRADQVRTAVENVLPLLSIQPHHIKLTLPSSVALLGISDIFQHQLMMSRAVRLHPMGRDLHLPTRLFRQFAGCSSGRARILARFHVRLCCAYWS